MNKKKIKVHSETVYIISMIILALSVAMAKTTDFGVSMIAAPSIILHEKFSALTVGQWEYILQAVLFGIFCILMRRFKFTYLMAFVTSVIYATFLDMWIYFVPLFNASVIPPESIPIAVRIILFVSSEILTTFAVALSFHTYFCPQVVDMFVKEISGKYKFDLTKFKWSFDVGMLVFSLLLSFILFRGLVGIGIGTFIIVAVNGLLVGFFDKLFRERLEIIPFSEKLQKLFLS